MFFSMFLLAVFVGYRVRHLGRSLSILMSCSSNLSAHYIRIGGVSVSLPSFPLNFLLLTWHEHTSEKLSRNIQQKINKMPYQRLALRISLLPMLGFASTFPLERFIINCQQINLALDLVVKLFWPKMKSSWSFIQSLYSKSGSAQLLHPQLYI